MKTKDTTPDAAPDATTTAETNNTNNKPKTRLPMFAQVRAKGCPIAAIRTVDPAATIKNAIASLNGKADQSPICTWDLIRGLVGLNDLGKQYAAEVSPDGPIQTGNPAECLSVLQKTPPTPRGIVFFIGAHRAIMDGSNQYNPAVCAGIWGLRDVFKSGGVGATLVLLAPDFTLPPELARDVVTIDEALPDAAQLAEIVDSIAGDAGIAKPEGQERAAIIDTLTGLGAFEAEQTLALSVTKAGIDRAGLWERKVRAIEATPGLTVYRGKETLDDVAGRDNAKRLLSATLGGALNCTCIVFADELDKSMSAASTDSSGTTQDQNKALLSYMQDNDIIGASALGPPGTGKTLLAKGLAGQFKVPLILMDLGAMKGSLVGQSEQNMRQALRVVHAISDGRALFLGACNRDQGLPPELRRRFSYLLLYFDLPERAELDAAWTIHSTRLSFQGKRVALRTDQCDRTGLNDDGWTGAEIRNCCLKAYAMDTTLTEAAKSIVPISKSAGDLVLASRKGASGKYIDATRPGLYTYRETVTPQTAPTGSRIGD